MVYKVAIFGDSLAKGVVYDDLKQRYIYLNNPCVNQILKQKGYTYTNYSRFGLTSDKAIEYISKKLAVHHDFDYAVLEIGGNDCDYDWEQIANNPEQDYFPKVKLSDFQKNIIEIIDIIQQYGIKPILVTLPPISSTKYFNWLSKSLNKDSIMKWLKDENVIYRQQEMYSLCITNIAREKKLELIDLRTSLLSVKDFDNYLCLDGIHITKEGHDLIAEKFKKEIISYE